MNTFELLMHSPWVMMALGLASHLLFKAMKVKDNNMRAEEPWSVGSFARKYLAPFLFSLIASFIFTAIAIEQKWPFWAAFFMSYASSSALYNIYPVITNPDMWKSIAQAFTKKVTPPTDEQP